jgi:hypothetical protein
MSRPHLASKPFVTGTQSLSLQADSRIRGDKTPIPTSVCVSPTAVTYLRQLLFGKHGYENCPLRNDLVKKQVQETVSILGNQ